MRHILSFLLIGSLYSARASADEKWTRLEGANLELLTDASPAKGREVLKRLAQVQDSLPLSARAVRILLFRSDAEIAPYKPPNAIAFYFAGRERDYIVLSATTPDLPRVALHEYVHAFLAARRAQLPAWFNEGLADALSKPGQPTLPNAVNLAALFKSPSLAREQYPVAWALVRMLLSRPEYQPQLGRFIDALAAGASHQAALKSAYGKSIPEVERDLRRFASSGGFQQPALDSHKAALVLRESEEVGLAFIDFLVDAGKVDEANRRLQAMADSPDASIARGDLALRAGDSAGAILEYSRAITQGTFHARAYLQRASLERDTPGKANRVIADLEMALRLEPDNNEARHLLEAVRQRAAPLQTSKPTALKTLEGELVELDCSGAAGRFILLSSGQKIAFRVTDPSEVVLKNSPEASLTLACGKLGEIRATIEYLPAADPAENVAGDIRSINFR